MYASYLSGEFSGDFEVRRGKIVLEFVPRSCSKGAAVEYLFAKASALHGVDAHLFVAGDDKTDESAFAKAKDLDSQAITVRVGDRATQTEAKLRIASPEDLSAILGQYLDYRSI